ncbi:hypothetical protein AG1IA_04575 [Rhizoctonia solani AG-1 IA]|uniref:Uncharacterized protein n=1 Tax=Thanatephorus cucumeris (strain AG1-IA) TaxID=983506 RepID=L8WTT7_THACA|nr:hypothetical protein AG1IA_04575 [Rhizoctonia solani AG-1 IA]
MGAVERSSFAAVGELVRTPPVGLVICGVPPREIDPVFPSTLPSTAIGAVLLDGGGRPLRVFLS